MSRSETIPTSLSPPFRTGRCRISLSRRRSIAFFIESFSSTDTGFLIIRFATIMVSALLPRIAAIPVSRQVPPDQIECSRQVRVGHQDEGPAVLLPEDERFPFLLSRDEAGFR